MLEDAILEKLRKLAMLKYDGKPESIRDFEVQLHYFLYIWDRENLTEEHEWRMTKGTTIDMWFEGKLDLNEHLYLDEIYPKKTQESKCSKCQEEGESEYIPPPREGKTTYIC